VRLTWRPILWPEADAPEGEEPDFGPEQSELLTCLEWRRKRMFHKREVWIVNTELSDRKGCMFWNEVPAGE
jgi:hypothetical protein